MASPAAPSRPALGQVADLGAFYDSTTDSFLPTGLLNRSCSPQVITSTPALSRHIRVVANDTLQSKLSGLGVYNELAASFLAGTVPVSGPGYYLRVERLSNQFVEGALFLELATDQASLELGKLQGRTDISLDTFQRHEATHLVAGITFGIRAVIAARMKVQPGVSNTASQLEHELRRLKSHIKQMLHSLDNNHENTNNQRHPHAQTMHEASENFHLAVFSDLENWRYVQNIRVDDVARFISQIPKLIRQEPGIPVAYDLVPVGYVRFVLGLAIGRNILPSQPQDQVLQQFICLFEKWRATRREIKDYLDATSHTVCRDINNARSVFGDDIDDQLHKGMEEIEVLKAEYGRRLKDVRNSLAQPQDLTKLLQKSHLSKASPKSISTLLDKAKKDVELKSLILKYGGHYLDHAGTKRMISTMSNIYVLYFTQEMKADKGLWEANCQILKNLLKRNPGDYIAAIAECHSRELSFKKPRVTFYRGGHISTSDMFTKMDLADQNLAVYRREELDKGRHDKPKDRRLVRIPCPGNSCDPESLRDWTCYICREPLEYCDQFMYCECGRAPAQAYKWQCSDSSHSCDFTIYDATKLENHISSLHSYKELNILLLGETGVGKSTFINAFYNYMLHSTLEEAMTREKLDYVVASSFSTQFVDDSSHEGSFVQCDVKFGESDSEQDGTRGDSATQKSTVYCIKMGDTLVRLIDTPGVGDVRGVDADARNLSNILRTLNQLPKLDGIVILLKPNAARLTLMFRFCVTELLSSLHRDAAHNIVWGFTNTRQSNYMPGDAFKPLERLLEKHASLGLKLTPRTVFCFDSESFRCLAVKKQLNRDMPNMDDFRRSWERSVKETKRLLQHFFDIEPHNVKSTISMNRAREVISQLTQPMAVLTDTIQRTIILNQDKIAELKDRRGKVDDLEKLLYFEKIDIQVMKLDHPRTVCKHYGCVQMKNVAGVMRPIYTSICHDPCHLTSVTEDTIGHCDLMRCAAFRDHTTRQYTNNCSHCSHHWQEHLHIRYSQTETVVQDIDPDIKGKIEANVSGIQSQKLMIKSFKNRIETTKRELDDIRDAAIHFGLFLKKNSIIPYNDAMIAYLDEMIKEERQYIGEAKAMGSPVEKNEQRLDMLVKSKQSYSERIRLLEESMSKSDEVQLLDEQGVEDLVSKLFALKNWGRQLGDMREMLDWSQSKDLREQEYRPKVSKTWQTFNLIKSTASNAVSAVTSRVFGHGTGETGASDHRRQPEAPRTVQKRTVSYLDQEEDAQHQGPLTRHKRRQMGLGLDAMNASSFHQHRQT